MFRKNTTLLICFSLQLLLHVPLSVAADGKQTSVKAAERHIDFTREIQPLLAKHCYSCHGADEQEGGLRLDGPKGAFAKLESDEIAIVPGNVKQSSLLTRIKTTDEDIRMPPEGKPLSPHQIALLTTWIKQGAEWKSHWAFQPAIVPIPPTPEPASWVQNPIDAFVLARLQKNNLAPASPADKSTLIRRLTFNVTGLPPSPDDVASFLNDNSPAAYEKLVDRLLSSPRYGEKWARHWLDLVRYADTNSFENDGDKPNAWRFRDYVIRAFNNDKPFNQFIREQLAGDELKQVTHESIIATGYYRLGVWDRDTANRKLAYYNELDDIVTTTGKVFLGITINCARCHDHKIDPVPQSDYYSFLAFFHGVKTYGVRENLTANNQSDISPPEISKLHAVRDQKRQALQKKMRLIEEIGIKKMSDADQRKTETDEREKVLKEKLAQHLSPEQNKEHKRLSDLLAKLLKPKLPPRTMALSLASNHSVPPKTYVLYRGNPESPGEQVQPGFPTIFNSPDPVLPQPDPTAKSSKRRILLANWIASDSNMLTARVMVNRIWQHHFSRGIVSTPNNFGHLGQPPTHPDLLNWLADEFKQGSWKPKRIHKLILMSSTYRMSSAANQAGIKNDPNNDLLWRFPARRLNSEEIRDAILAVNGELNLKMYGPGVYPTISKEVLQGQSSPGKGWKSSNRQARSRRSIYIHVKRSLLVPLLSIFDFADTDSTCPERFVTTQPAQALAMVNGLFLNQQANYFAEHLIKQKLTSPREQVKRSIELAFSRPPHNHELEAGIKFIARLQTKHKLSDKAALKFYCLTLYNRNEFLYID